jgi:hypothetical protein
MEIRGDKLAHFLYVFWKPRGSFQSIDASSPESKFLSTKLVFLMTE